MRVLHICSVLALVTFLFGLTLLIPCGVSLFYADDKLMLFAPVACGCLLVGLLGWLVTRNRVQSFSIDESLLIIVLLWLWVVALAAYPWYAFGFSYLDACFESMSAITTTGAELFSGLDQWPKSLLFYHQWLQWLGGLGIIVLALALMPMFGIGGMQLYRSEVGGPVKDRKLAPRVREAASALWTIYLWLTVLCSVAYAVCGLGWFEAIGEALTTVSTGGFALHDASFAFYHNPAFESVAVIFMLLGSMHFALHNGLFRRADIAAYFADAELASWWRLLVYVVVVVISALLLQGDVADLVHGFRYGGFTAVAMLTTTGFKNVSFASWAGGLPLMLLLTGYVGGCVGSTSGGVKMMRWLVVRKEVLRALRQVIHPSSVMRIHFGEQALSETIIQSIRGYVMLFWMTLLLIWILLVFSGLPVADGFAAASSTLTNLGVSIGSFADNYSQIDAVQKLILMVSMLAGRLEILTLLVCLMPSFWQKF
jgi:trk system potassium uptake protein